LNRPVASGLSDYLDRLRRDVQTALDRVFAGRTAPPLVLDAMRYALFGGGKRLRPCLTLAAADAAAPIAGVDLATARQLAMPCACAVELVHTYSLVHDDLPAMDDDQLRRGRATTHVVYGDGIAILAGDGLLTEAFAVIAASPSRAVPPGSPSPPADARLRAVTVLALAAGADGMVGGQTIDLAAAGRVGAEHAASPLDRAALEDMHARKTGALIAAAATLGAIAVGADEATIQAIHGYAIDLGLAFQIVDDVLDVEGSNHELGKTAGKDAAAGKPTYAALYGIEESRRRAAAHVERARATLATARIGGRLSELAEWSLTRRA
jgi:geranylgeranyl diphosphate synthase type II